MNRWKFPLETVLDYRKSLEEQARREFMEAKEALELEERRLGVLEAARRKSADDLKARQTRSADPRELLLYHGYLQQVGREIELQQRRVTEVMRRYTDKRETLLSTSKDKKVLEKLKERKEDLSRVRVRREERRRLDETVRGGHGREDS
ncbi:MAG: flagellar export protein FliJ [Nitrospirae bacterium]|nr:flagellar export protein FliJ [Nitrospirota bacterium]